jgi:hypothetical protein
VTPGSRDALEVDALRTDRYIEALVVGQEPGAAAVPTDVPLDPDVRAAADALARALVRVHPSFRFEERLAGRLAAAARGMRLAPAAGGEGVLPFRLPLGAGPGLSALPDGVALDPRELRPLLIRGALTSAALSLAGAAWVAWRKAQQPARSPMARAVRAAREHRLARRLS